MLYKRDEPIKKVNLCTNEVKKLKKGPEVQIRLWIITIDSRFEPETGDFESW